MTPLLLVVILLLAFVFWKLRRPRNFPPGPWAVPILGSFYQVDFTNPLPDLQKLAKKYGSVFSLHLGNSPAVILHGYQAVKEALVNYGAEFSDRPEDAVFAAMLNKKGVLSVPYGQHWKEQRKFILKQLKNFGLGKTSMEARIHEQTRHLVKYFEDNIDNPFDPKEIMLNTVANVMCCILFGRRFDYSHRTMENILRIMYENTELISNFWGELYNAVPFIRILPLPFQKIFRNQNKIMHFLSVIIDEHKKTQIPEDPRDIIDCYLEEMKKRPGDPSFDDENMLALMFDLFEAGTNAQAAITIWALLFMMAYPDIQAKCYKEIKSIVIENEDISYKDRFSVPYTHAVIYEVQRLGCVVPLSVPHCFTKDVSFLGYTIPKGTRVITDLSSALWDETQWKFPHEFNPANFLDDNGQFIKPSAFIPYSAGPRACLGENLAQMEVFLMFTTLLRKFEFIWPSASISPDLTPIYGIVMFPSPFKVGFKRRQS